MDSNSYNYQLKLINSIHFFAINVTLKCQEHLTGFKRGDLLLTDIIESSDQEIYLIQNILLKGTNSGRRRQVI